MTDFAAVVALLLVVGIIILACLLFFECLGKGQWWR